MCNHTIIKRGNQRGINGLFGQMVLHLLAHDYNYKSILVYLGCNKNTLVKEMALIRRQLGVQSNEAAIYRAVKLGYIKIL